MSLKSAAQSVVASQKSDRSATTETYLGVSIEEMCPLLRTHCATLIKEKVTELSATGDLTRIRIDTQALSGSDRALDRLCKQAQFHSRTNFLT